MFKQNYGWASHGVNLTAVVYPYPDGEDMRQFMCLVYRGDNTTQHPLNSGWVETDRLVYNYADAESVVLSDDENTQYIGYIEGPPPFYANNAQELSGEAAFLRENKPISELEFSTSTSTTTEKETKFGFTAKIKVKLKKKFSASLEGAFARKNSSEYSTTIKNTMSVHSEEESKGYYFVLKPVIMKTKYDVYDVNDNSLYQYTYYYMTKPQIDSETPELAEGLDSGDPETFYKRDISFAAYQTKEIGASSVSCTDDNTASTTIEVEQSNTVSNKWSGTLSASYTFAKVLEISGKGRIETSTTTTTSVGNEIKAISNLNKAVLVGDASKINYNVHWLQRVDGLDNWWIPENAKDQNVWCVTYEVTKYDTLTEGGKLQITDIAKDEFGLPEKFELAQNYPNPFNPSTSIKYALPERSYVKLEIINLVGEVVETLVSANMASGIHEIKWNASNFASGVYIINISSVGLETNQNFQSTKKALLLK